MKILIINENRHNSIGGIEKYTRTISELFHSLGHEIYEYAFNLNPERIDMYEEYPHIKPLNKINKTNKSISLAHKRKLIKKGVNDIKEIFNNFDLIINQTSNIKWFKEFYNSKKVIYVQHFNPDFYKQKYTADQILQPIIYFGMWLFGIKNPFKMFQNFVVFTEHDKNKLKISKDKKVWSVPLSSYNKNEIKLDNNKRNDKLVYFGRLDNRQKNIKKIVQFANKNKIYVDFYGQGNTKMIKGEYCKYKGVITTNLNNIIKNYKYSILLSKYEGLPFSVIESLSLGVPIIITDFCPSAKWLSENKGYLVSNKKDLKNLKYKIDGNEELSKNCIQFSKLHFSKEQFNKNWIKILKSFN